MRRRFALSFLLLVLLLVSAGVVRSPLVRRDGSAPAVARRIAPDDRRPVPAVDLDVRTSPRSVRALEAPEGMSHHGQIVVDVVDADGRPVEEADVMPVDCPGFEAGPAGEHQVDVGPCVLQAVRHDGVVLARGPVSTAVVDDVDAAYVSLQVPEQRYGGIGIEVAAELGGLRVVDVWPGAPADQVGLSPGDMIVALEGQPVAGMGPERFGEEVVGAEGTSIELTVALAQDTGVAEQTLRVTRAYLQG